MNTKPKLLDCGGKRSATPLSNVQRHSFIRVASVRAKAVSPLRSATALHTASRLASLYLVVSLAALLLTGCAHIPRESVELSRNVGAGIAENHRAYTEMVNLYFDQKRTAIDTWIERDYTPLYLATVRTKFNTNAFDEAITGDIIQRVSRKRDQLQAELEKSRRTVLDRVEAHDALLVQANAQLTALLQSAVNVHEANAAFVGSLTNASGGKVDFAALDQTLNNYLLRAGDASQKATSLFDEVQSVLNSPLTQSLK